ncbi:hypothetical protein, conserved [Trypanosoma brucei brucei TREU927]|uniref:Uncharacterized protein n=1 Tax=Trypanosoma brucei brucei (strain 927/4 GUTat10.1) TaxID=185431 RepID=Q384K6_TRYB2|nr:hypothetical protein, conserved [Trypanosoma brucei brucei TREU927]EAN79775.1 hypothetical protein, conserved [Trypanosoma brucei brucei TREU927]
MDFLFGTMFFAATGALGVFFTPFLTRDLVGLVRILCVTAAFCCWLSWALIYLSQVHPLLIPTRNIKKE